MTDNEIIKALECCCVVGECADCPSYSVEKSDCKGIDWNGVYDLITRQKAEIERLKATVDSFTDIGKLYSEIKAEAIKEFAERLKELAYEGYSSKAIPECVFVSVEEINNLVKEMVGDIE